MSGEKAVYTYNSNLQLETVTTASTVYTFTYDEFGNVTAIRAGDSLLASYTYGSNNGKLTTLTYGNGKIVQYTYDELDRVSEICYTTRAIDNENEIVEHRYIYTYTASGAIHSVECTESGRKYQYNYNSRGQLTGYTELTASGNAYTDLAQSFFWYDDLNRLEYTQTSFRYAVGDTNYLSDADYYDAVGYWYTYDNSVSGNSGAGTDVGALTELEILGGGLNTGATISYGYDSLYRLATRTTTANGSAGFSQTVNYGYRQVSTGRTSGQVSSYQSVIGNTTTRYTYTYDSSGNITRITDQSGNVTRYTYDKLGQLTREDNPYLGKTYVYAYDKAGNRTSKTTYDYTTGTLGTDYTQVNYSYDDGAWGDQLTGTTYDEIGNPDTYNGYSLTWNGRQLMKMSMNNGQFEYRFTYNDEGIRTSKTYGSTTHYYTLNGSQIVTETWVTKSSDGTETPNHFLVYLYDESGAPIGLQYRNKTYEKYDFDTYYFEKNLQGDIIAIYTEAGTKIGSYTYDAWGNCTSSYATGATTAQKKIVQMFNPFRYRGYYYDYDTGLYYLQSRYYNPATGRFLNADGYVNANGDLIGFNMYAYCSNSPVMNADYSGREIRKEICITCWGGTGHYPYSDFDLAIFDAANEFNVDPTMVASVISAERKHNVNIFDLADVPLAYLGIDTSIGVGQVKVNTAKLMEDLGYMEPSPNRFARIKRLNDMRINIRYTAAYLAYMRDTWKNEYPSIERDVAVWGTLYNIGKTAAHSNPKPNQFGLWCVEEYGLLKSIYEHRR